jgi:molybdopterin guanine dinucleotide-containing S/N-oxide reductase-like protein
MAEKVFINCTVGGAVKVHVEDGKITSVRPFVLTEEDGGHWTIGAKGKKFSPPRKSTLGPFVFAEKQRVYGEDRVRYPMVRVDFDPNGERNPQNRGKSGYRRVSWDEALDLVASEVKRVQTKYGKEAVTAITGSHHNWGLLGYKMSAFGRFFNMLGYTQIFDNPDSWEGFHWGGPHVYGYSWRLGCPEPYDMLEDCLQYTDMIIHWANDPDTIRGGYCGQETAIWRVWMRELGIKMIYIDPFCNFTAVKDASKWIAPRPGTDTAMAEAIAYIWLTEGAYDKDFIERKTHGFDEWKKHILGETDGQPKTAEWAAELTGVKVAIIKALAKEWAKKNTILACGARGGWGGAHRTAYGHEWARLMIYLAAMQGLGKAGNNLWGAQMGSPVDCDFYFPAYADPGGSIAKKPICDYEPVNPVKQKLYRTKMPEAVLTGHIEWMGDGFCGKSVDQQFNKYTYPMEGCSEVKLFYRYGGSFMGTMSETNDWVRMYTSDKLECVVNQSVWMDPETKFADIILPACTSFEREDIAEFANPGGYSNHGFTGNNYRIIVYQQKCIEPVGESMSDYDIFTCLAERLGFKEEYTEGKTVEDWIRRFYDVSDMPKVMSFEEFKEKGYYVVPVDEDRKPTPAFRWFYEDRPCDTPDTLNPLRGTDKAHLLDTPTGKLEFFAESLIKNTPYDKERAPVARYQHSWEGHKSPLYKKYPYHLISPHPRFSYHTHYDAHCDWLAEIPDHRILKEDGNYYLTVKIHPETAAKKGIKDGDIVSMFNDRGEVLGAAQLTERVKPHTIHAYCSSGRYVPLVPGEPSTDKGGCVNILTCKRDQSKYVAGFAPNSTLIDIKKWEGIK